MSDKAKGLLGDPKTKNYKPSYIPGPEWMYGIGMFNNRVLEEMRRDAQVSLCLNYRKSVVHTAEFEYGGNSPAVKEFVAEQTGRFWRRGLPIALEHLTYGYTGAEVMYTDEGGLVKFDYLKPLYPFDVRAWTRNGRFAYIRVNTLLGLSGSTEMVPNQGKNDNAVCLEAAERDRPAKGIWFVHENIYHQWYGRSILYPAWLPWRWKTMPDGAIDVIAKWYYRHAYSGMLIRYPDVTFQDSPGGVEVPAQDHARQIGQMIKTGANVTMSSETDENGKYLWDIVQYAKAEGTGVGKDLIDYINAFLDVQIQRGIGIPDELITHQGNTGGYSRSQVSLTAYLIAAELILHEILETWVTQVLKPLVMLNFGMSATFSVHPKPLLPPGDQPPPPAAGNPLAGLAGGGPAPLQFSALPLENDLVQLAWSPFRTKSGGVGAVNYDGSKLYGEQARRVLEHQSRMDRSQALQRQHDYLQLPPSVREQFAKDTNEFLQEQQAKGAADTHAGGETGEFTPPAERTHPGGKKPSIDDAVKAGLLERTGENQALAETRDGENPSQSSFVPAALEAKKFAAEASEPAPKEHGNPNFPAASEAAKLQQLLPTPQQWLDDIKEQAKTPRWKKTGAAGALRSRLAGLCDLASEHLQKKLEAKGIKSKVIYGEYEKPDGRKEEHAYIQTASGIIIDPTESQFRNDVHVGQIRIYPSPPERFIGANASDDDFDLSPEEQAAFEKDFDAVMAGERPQETIYRAPRGGAVIKGQKFEAGATIPPEVVAKIPLKKRQLLHQEAAPVTFRDVVTKAGGSVAKAGAQMLHGLNRIANKSKRLIKGDETATHAAKRMAQKVAVKYKRLEQRYGRAAAVAMAGTYLGSYALFPINPAASFAVSKAPFAIIGVMEGIKRAKNYIAPKPVEMSARSKKRRPTRARKSR